jgi:hypothetical protein
VLTRRCVRLLTIRGRHDRTVTWKPLPGGLLLRRAGQAFRAPADGWRMLVVAQRSEPYQGWAPDRRYVDQG